MVRWLLLGLLFCGFGTGLGNGWFVVHWSQLLREAGLIFNDLENPFNWNEFIVGGSDRKSSTLKDDLFAKP